MAYTRLPDGAFVISNGRCGSTLLSNLIAEQQDTLPVQEFGFVMGPISWAISPETVLAGDAYEVLLSRPNKGLSTLFRLDRWPPEIRYPVGGRWAGRIAELPAILAVTLPALTDEPDALFDELVTAVRAFPAQPLASHHQMLFRLLCRLTGRHCWVERSGASALDAGLVTRAFPRAKVVYLTRDPIANARSMCRHPAFQLLDLRIEFRARCGLDPYQDEHFDIRVVPEDLHPYLPEFLTAELLASRGARADRFGALRAFMAGTAEQAWRDAPQTGVLRLSYEELVADPAGQLVAIGRFLGFGDPEGWAGRVAGRVRAPVPVTT